MTRHRFHVVLMALIAGVSFAWEAAPVSAQERPSVRAQRNRQAGAAGQARGARVRTQPGLAGRAIGGMSRAQQGAKRTVRRLSSRVQRSGRKAMVGTRQLARTSAQGAARGGRAALGAAKKIGSMASRGAKKVVRKVRSRQRLKKEAQRIAKQRNEKQWRSVLNDTFAVGRKDKKMIAKTIEKSHKTHYKKALKELRRKMKEDKLKNRKKKD